MTPKVGDRIPLFTAVDSAGNDFGIRDFIGQPFVIYFYPKDDTSICTRQACSFRDRYQEFRELGAEVIGISPDGVKSHLEFKNRYQLPYILLSDKDKKLRKLFGVPNNMIFIPGRQTYVIDKNGSIRMIFNSTEGEIHIEKALEMLRNLD